MGGILVHEAADIQYTILDNANTITFSRIPNSLSTLTWQGEAGFKYQMRGSGTVGISTSYLHSSLNNPYTDVLALNGQPLDEMNSVEIELSAVALLFNLGFRF